MNNEVEQEHVTSESGAVQLPVGQGAPNRVRIVSLEEGITPIERFALAVARGLRRVTPAFVVMLADFGSLVAAGQIALQLRHIVAPSEFSAGFHPVLLMYAGLMILCYLAVGLYSAVAYSGPDELRRIALVTTTLTIVMTIVTYVSRSRFDIGVSMFLVAWGCALFTVPLARAVVRGLFAKRAWWGRKAIVLSTDVASAHQLVGALRAQPRLGLRPVAVLTTEPPAAGAVNPGLPQLHGPGAALTHAREQGIHYAIVTVSLLDDPEGLTLIRRYETVFKHWLLVPSLPPGYSLWVRTRDLDGVLALELTDRLLKPSHQLAKRAMDLTLTLLSAPVLVPITLVIALAIKLDSRGRVLYSQQRLGRDGMPFRAFKFRSMIEDADRVLHAYLEHHPELRDEWQATQKLKEDPRITRVGRFLRKTSLDELPQLINVLRGEMSLVGPRPIVEDEVCRYNAIWELYKRVRPGITGQWQISGRNDTTYETRTAMDAYYVRNWSVWLDLYILARTVKVVLRRDGAY